MGSSWLLADEVVPLKSTYRVKAGQAKSKIFSNTVSLSAETKAWTSEKYAYLNLQ